MTSVHPTYRTRHGLTDSAVELLDVGHYVVLGTENPDGTVHLVPAMYLFAEGRVYIETSGATRKARNLRDRPRATVLVQDHRAAGTAWVSGTGPAVVIGGPEAQRLGRRIRSRYYTEQGEEQVGSIMARYDDTVLAVAPDRWLSWDMTAFNAMLAEHGAPFDEEAAWYRPVIGAAHAAGVTA